jgi:hypothetical protein
MNGFRVSEEEMTSHLARQTPFTEMEAGNDERPTGERYILRMNHL